MDEEKSVLILLGELKGKIEAIFTVQVGQNQRLDEHDKRITNLENSRAWILGACAVIATLVAGIIALIQGAF